jgi:hypothetical protein
MLLLEIVAGCPFPSPSAPNSHPEVNLPPDVPVFVSEIIEEGLRPIAEEELSFIDIFETLKANAFQIVAGVDSDEVSAFVRRVESAVQSGETE